MKMLLSALGFTGLLFVAGLIGMATQSPGLLLPVFCLWTPTAWAVGYAFASAGGKVESPVKFGGAPKAKKPVVKTEFN